MMGRSRFVCEDLLHYSILSRLPTKDLLRFKCVSTSWQRLISSDFYFIHLHSQRMNCSGLLHMDTWTGKHEFFPVLPLLSWQDSTSLNIPGFSFQSEVDWWGVIASCNGLVCILSGVRDAKQLYLGNPVLKDWKLLPHMDSLTHNINNYGLAVEVEVEKSAISYSLVMLKTTYNGYGEYNILSGEFMFYVVSSKSGSKWHVAKTRAILYEDTRSYSAHSIYAHGVLYWVFTAHLMWFDVKDEQSGFYPLPPGSKNCPPGQVGGGRGIGELTYSRILRGSIEIWSMDQSSSCWTKKYCISLKSMTEGNPEVFYYLCCHVKPPLRWKVIARHYKPSNIRLTPFEGGGLIFFSIGARDLFKYDMETGEAELMSRSINQSSLVSHKNCLVPSPSLVMPCVKVPL